MIFFTVYNLSGTVNKFQPCTRVLLGVSHTFLNPFTNSHFPLNASWWLVIITFGGTAVGMATRKTALKARNPGRVYDPSEGGIRGGGSLEFGLRLRRMRREPRVFPKVLPKVQSNHRPSPSLLMLQLARGMMISLMRRFLDTQEQREDRYLREL